MSAAPIIAANEAALARLATTLLRPDPNDSPMRWADYRALVERPRFAAVFTAHPTFANPREVTRDARGTGQRTRRRLTFASHRPADIALAEEFDQAAAAIARGRDAIDRFNAALLAVAREAWPDRWTELAPRPVILSTWVGYDTDGRTDIGWWDTMRLAAGDEAAATRAADGAGGAGRRGGRPNGGTRWRRGSVQRPSGRSAARPNRRAERSSPDKAGGARGADRQGRRGVEAQIAACP